MMTAPRRKMKLGRLYLPIIRPNRISPYLQWYFFTIILFGINTIITHGFLVNNFKTTTIGTSIVRQARVARLVAVPQLPSRQPHGSMMIDSPCSSTRHNKNIPPRCGGISSSSRSRSSIHIHGQYSTQLHYSFSSLDEWIYLAQSTADRIASQTLSNASTATSMTTMNMNLPSLTSLLGLYAAGLLTSLSPCSLSLLPLTLSYLSLSSSPSSSSSTTYSKNNNNNDNTSSNLVPTLAYAAGLASVLCALGISVTTLGGVLGAGLGAQVLAAISSLVALLMGLQLLEIVDLPLLNVDVDVDMDMNMNMDVNKDKSNAGSSSDDSSSMLQFDEEGNLLPPQPTPTDKNIDNHSNNHENNNNNNNNNNSSLSSSSLVRTFLLGGSSALVASPCATPVLTSLLAYIASSTPTTTTTTLEGGGIVSTTSMIATGGGGGGSTTSYLFGILLLLCYTLGYTTPLLIVGATGGKALANARSLAMYNNDDDDGDDNDDNDMMMSKIVQWIGLAVNPLTAAFLIGYGTNGLLESFLGDPSLAGLAPILE